MSDKAKRTDDNLCGVNCSVANCNYHSLDDTCHADHIKVENRAAVTTSETNCSTFQIKR